MQMNTEQHRILLAPVVALAVAVELSALMWLMWASLPQTTRAQGTIHYVTPDGNCGTGYEPCYDNIQAAVDAARSGDEIRVAAGLYLLAGGSGQVAYVDKDLVIRGGYTADNWDIPHPETNATELTAMGQGRVMIISGTLEVTVEGLHLTFGDAEGLGDGMPGGESGGGLYVFEATATLRHSWLLNNTAPAGYGLGGGGLYARESVLTLEDNVVQDNYGSWGGGLLFDDTDATVRDCHIESNEAGGMGSRGGGIAAINNSDVTLSSTMIQGNETTFVSGSEGGGVYVENSHAIFVENTIEGNYTRREAAGVGIGGGAVVLLTGNQILNNDGNGYGGGLCIGWPGAADAVTLTHNTIKGNDAIVGGGVYVENTQALFEGNLIESNMSVVDAGGAYLGGSKPITFRANLVRGNAAGDTLSGGDGAGVYVATSQAILSGNVIQHNAATRRYGQGGSGGGLLIGPDADCTLANNVVTDNTGQTSGPGIAVFGAEPGLYHNTIANNTGGDGSGLYVAMGGMDDEPGRPTLYNTIIASQTLGVNVSDDAPQNLTAMYGVLWWGNTEDITGTVFAFDEVTGAPAFVDPAGHDYHISPSSAAIDAGRTDAGVTEDIDGQARPHYDGYDLGADEAWAVVAVKSVAPGVAEPEDVVTYTIALTNTTDEPMTVRLTDTLPSWVESVGPITYTGGSVGVPTSIVTWTGTVFTDAPILIAWPVKIASDVSLGITIPNTATVRDAYGFFRTEPALIMVPRRYHDIYLPLVLRD
jgi:uncharacterized repeat protein (TIGR01451 family)